jgi:hypothetical protein
MRRLPFAPNILLNSKQSNWHYKTNLVEKASLNKLINGSFSWGFPIKTLYVLGDLTETLISYHIATRCHIPQDDNLNESSSPWNHHNSHHADVKMETVRTSETMISYHIVTRCQIPQDRVLNVFSSPWKLQISRHADVMWRWRQQGPPKRRCSTSLHGVTSQKTSTWSCIAVKISGHLTLPCLH